MTRRDVGDVCLMLWFGVFLAVLAAAWFGVLP